MKYIKTFEKLNKYEEAGIIEIIKNEVDATTFIDDDTDIDDANCPFLTELALLHQKDYIDEIYDSVKIDDAHSLEMENVSLEDFTKVYNKLLKKAPKKIIDYLKKEPKWYKDWMNHYEDLDIPEYIINANKFNI